MKAVLITIILTSASIAHAARGGDVGNGGDAIVCAPSPDNFLNGTYSLDYILTLKRADRDDESAIINGWEGSAQRIQKILDTKVPALANDFREFVANAFNTTDYTKRDVWEVAPFGLKDLKDEEIASLIPPNCLSGGESKVIQAVIRQYKSFSGSKSTLVYKFVPRIIDALKAEAPLQLSYLMVHEWLWNFSGGVDRNRRVNSFLHSKRIETMSSAEIEAELKGMGFFLPEVEADALDPRSCNGTRLKSSDVFERFPDIGQRLFHMLSQATLHSRRRTVDCPPEVPQCNRLWMDSTRNNYYFRNFKFFAAVAWFANEATFPIRIVSPEAYANDQVPYRNGMGQIGCRFNDKSELNLECEIQHETLASMINGHRADAKNRIVGVLTNECLRLESRFIEEGPAITMRGGSREGIEQQNVIFARFKWRE